MNNLRQKNIMYENDMLNTMPYTKSSSIKLKQNFSVTDDMLNNTYQQLINNDLVVKNYGNINSDYTIGVKDIANIDGAANGSKFYYDEGKTQLSIIRKVEVEAGNTISKVTNFPDEEVTGISQFGQFILVFTTTNSYFKKISDTEYTELNSDLVINDNYSDDGRMFVAANDGVYQIIETLEQEKEISAFKISDEDLNKKTFTSVCYHKEAEKIIVGTDENEIYHGNFTQNAQLVDFKYMGNFYSIQYQANSDILYQTNPGRVKDIKIIDYDDYTKYKSSILMGTENGLYRGKSISCVNNPQEYQLPDETNNILNTFVYNDCVHIITKDNVYSMWDNSPEKILLYEASVKNIIGYKVFKYGGKNYAILWTTDTIYKYSYSSNDDCYTCQELFNLETGVITAADIMKIQDHFILMIAVGNNIVAYDVDDITYQYSNVYEGSSPVTQLMVKQNNNAVYFISNNKLFKIIINGLVKTPNNNIDNIEEVNQLTYQKMRTITFNNEKYILTVCKNNKALKYIDQQGNFINELDFENLVQYENERIINFDGFKLDNDGQSGFYIFYLTNKHIFYKSFKGTEELKIFVTFDKEVESGSISHTGHFIVINVQDIIYTIKDEDILDYDQKKQEYYFGTFEDMYPNENNGIFCLSSNGYLYSLGATAVGTYEEHEQRQETEGAYWMGKSDGIYYSFDKEDGQYFLGIYEHDSYGNYKKHQCEDGYEQAYFTNINNSKYVNCSTKGVCIRSYVLPWENVLCNLFPLTEEGTYSSSQGMFSQDQDGYDGIYAINRKLVCIGDVENIKTITTNESPHNKHIYVRLNNKAYQYLDVYETVTNNCVKWTRDEEQWGLSTLEGDILNISRQSNGTTVCIVTTRAIYYSTNVQTDWLEKLELPYGTVTYDTNYQEEEDSSQLLGTNNGESYNINGSTVFSYGSDTYQIFTWGTNIIYADYLAHDHTTLNMLYYGDDVITSIASFNINDSVYGIVFNTNKKLYVRKITVNSQGNLIMSDEKMPEFDDVDFSGSNKTIGKSCIFDNHLMYSMYDEDGSFYVIRDGVKMTPDDIEGSHGNAIIGFDVFNYNGKQIYNIFFDNNGVYQPNDYQARYLTQTEYGTIFRDFQDFITTGLGTYSFVVEKHQKYDVDRVIVDEEERGFYGINQLIHMRTNLYDLILIRCTNTIYYTKEFSNINSSTKLYSLFTANDNIVRIDVEDQNLFVVYDNRVEKYNIIDTDDNISYLLEYSLDIPEDYELIAVQNINELLGLDDSYDGVYFRKKNSTTIYIVTWEMVFNNLTRIHLNSKITKAVYNGYESLNYPRTCYFLDEDHKIIRFNHNLTEIVVMDVSDKNVDDFDIANNVLFCMDSTSKVNYYFMNDKWSTFNDKNKRGVIKHAKSNGINFFYSFKNVNGLFMNVETEDVDIDVGAQSQYTSRDGDSPYKLLNSRSKGNCSLIGKTSDGKYTLLYLQDDELQRKQFGEFDKANKLIAFNDSSEDNKYVIINEDYEGIYIFDGNNVNIIPRFDGDANREFFSSATLIDDNYKIFYKYNWTSFQGWTYDGVGMFIIGSNDIDINTILNTTEEKYVIAAEDGEYGFSYRKGTITIPTKLTAEENKHTHIQKISDSDNVWYLLVKEDAIYKSSNYLVWSKFLKVPQKDNEDIIHTAVLAVNEKIYLIGTNNGLYTTEYKYTVVDDMVRFGEKELKKLYQETKNQMTADIDEMMIYHKNVEKEYGHTKNSIISSITNETSGLMDVCLDNLSQSKIWPTTDVIDEKTTVVMNDLVNDIIFGSLTNGDITVNLSNFLQNDNNIQFEYIKKVWKSGLTELYIYIPTTNTYYINHIEGVPNCSDKIYGVNFRRTNIQQKFGTQKSMIKGDINEVYSCFNINLDNSIYNIDCLLEVQVNGNSLPLKIYIENDATVSAIEGYSSSMYHSFIQPTVLSSYEINNGDAEKLKHKFTFNCFGSDSQSVKIMFQDNNVANCIGNFKLVFKSNTMNDDTNTQFVSMDPNRKVKLLKNTFTHSTGSKYFTGWSFEINPSDNSIPDLYDEDEFSYDQEHIPEDIYKNIESGSTVYLYAIWCSYQTSSQDSIFLLKSNKDNLYIDKVTINKDTELKDNVVISYGD